MFNLSGPQPKFSLLDFLIYLLGIVMLLSFFFMTWFFVPDISVDRSVAGVQVMSPISTINLAFIIPIAAVIAMTSVAWGVNEPKIRRFIVPATGIAGVLGLAYYALFFLFNGRDAFYRVFQRSIQETLFTTYDIDALALFLAPYTRPFTNGIGFGFWVCFGVSIFFVWQAFIPRPKVQEQAKKQVDMDSREPPISQFDRVFGLLYQIPWWALLLVLVGVLVAVSIANDALYSNIYRQLRAGVALTLRVSFTGYGTAMLIGLLVGVIRSNPPKVSKKNPFSFALSLLYLLVYNLATLFVEVLRGLPVLIVLLISAFIAIPEIRNYLNETYNLGLNWRGSGIETAIIALSLAYGAFLSEIFRAGIQSVEKGQIEASKSVGMNYLQTMRFIVLPQAVRRVLPPLGNDFVAMLKDSSLVAILGIRDVTQIARVSSGSSFRYLETYLTVAVIYLMMTVLGSLAIRVLEGYLQQETK